MKIFISIFDNGYEKRWKSFMSDYLTFSFFLLTFLTHLLTHSSFKISIFLLKCPVNNKSNYSRKKCRLVNIVLKIQHTLNLSTAKSGKLEFSRLDNTCSEKLFLCVNKKQGYGL